MLAAVGRLWAPLGASWVALGSFRVLSGAFGLLLGRLLAPQGRVLALAGRLLAPVGRASRHRPFLIKFLLRNDRFRACRLQGQILVSGVPLWDRPFPRITFH